MILSVAPAQPGSVGGPPTEHCVTGRFTYTK